MGELMGAEDPAPSAPEAAKREAGESLFAVTVAVALPIWEKDGAAAAEIAKGMDREALLEAIEEAMEWREPVIAAKAAAAAEPI